jgi:pyruvate kinase
LNRVKVVATIGPKTGNVAALKALRQAGMNIARLNGSHSNIAWHQRAFELLRQVDPEIPVLFDLPGGKVRTTNVGHELTITAGQRVIFCNGQGDLSRTKVPVDYPDLHRDVQVGDTITMDDGSLSLVVDSVVNQEVACYAKHPGTIRNSQGVHLPRLTSRGGFLSSRDREMIAFAAGEGVDFIGVSSVGTAADVEAVREAAGYRGPAIVSKIETRPAIDNLTDLIGVSDCLLIDRGDLSVETRPEIIGLLQKQIIAEANRASCPVIVGTEILHTMIDSPVPTKAEISDITNSIQDGAAALMLSAETAIGNYPLEAVTVMRRVADAVSEGLPGPASPAGGPRASSVPEAIGEAIASICRHLEVTKIVAITISGYAARMVAARMPSQPILAVSNDPDASRRFNLLRGTKGVHVDIPFSRTSMEHIPRCLEELWRRGELVDEDLILVTALGYPKSGNRMNLIETHRVADLRDSLGW